MATVDKLAIYNNALLLLGQRSLASLTEDRKPRHLLDAAYDLGAPEYCLEIVQPDFASKTAKLNSPVISAVHDLDSVHTLPTDYLTLVKNPHDDTDTGVFSDAKLDQPVSRYIIEGNTIACEHATLYLRYVANTLTLTDWTPSFVRVLAAYLAREISINIAPDEYSKLNDLFIDRVEAARGLEADREPPRTNATTVTLTNAWRKIYNDALLVLGLDGITTNNDDSNRRTKLDRTLDSDLVADILEDTGWTFALTSAKSTYNSSLEPEWGYQRVHEQPTDLHRISGLFLDEYMNSPLKDYKDEGDYFFCGYDDIFIQYVSTDWLTTPDNWPAAFKRLIAARMAKDAVNSLQKEGAANPADVNEEYKRRRSEAMSIDAVSAPPRRLANGNWNSARFRGNYRGRP